MARVGLYPVRKVSGLGHKIIMAAFSHFLEKGHVSSSKFSRVPTSLPVPCSSCEVFFWPDLCEPAVSVGQQRFWLSHGQVPSEAEGHLEASIHLPPRSIQ